VRTKRWTTSARFSQNDLNGHKLLSNNSKWINFLLVKNRNWFFDNVVLIGDALHTAHFSIGSGTKLAIEDAIALAESFHKPHSLRGFNALHANTPASHRRLPGSRL
jgi:anthraniloyl-CoA monooxygenase